MWSSSLPVFTGRQTQTLGLAAFLAAIEVRNCLCYEVKKKYTIQTAMTMVILRGVLCAQDSVREWFC